MNLSGAEVIVGAEADRGDLLAVPQPQIADDACHVLGRHLRRRIGELPARLPQQLVGLEQPAGGEGGLGLLGHLVGLVEQHREKAFGGALLGELLALGLVLRLQGLDVFRRRSARLLGEDCADEREQQQYGEMPVHASFPGSGRRRDELSIRA